jgi:3-oxoacyl-[acyl-carrier-protein] synthase II
VIERREVWITGIGLVTCLGEGLEATWQGLEHGLSCYDQQSFAPYVVHPLKPINFDKQIPKKSDQRQMETWQRVGVYTAGLALADSGLAGKPELLDNTDMIVAAFGGERDIAVDIAILSESRKAAASGALLNERLMNDLRPTLFLAQLPNLLAGNISLIHGVVGSSRTFLGEESAGVDAVRTAHARIASGQSDIMLVGGACHGTRWDLLLLFETCGLPLRGGFAPVWDRGPEGGVAFATLGAFLVLENAEHARARGAAPHARLSAVRSARSKRQTGDIEVTLRRQWEELAPLVARERAVIVSGASGFEPATAAEGRVLKEIGLPVRNTGTYTGHGIEAQFLANLAIACAAIEHGKLFPPAGSGDSGDAPPELDQVVVTGIGNWRGEGLALVERTSGTNRTHNGR